MWDLAILGLDHGRAAWPDPAGFGGGSSGPRHMRAVVDTPAIRALLETASVGARLVVVMAAAPEDMLSDRQSLPAGMLGAWETLKAEAAVGPRGGVVVNVMVVSGDIDAIAIAELLTAEVELVDLLDDAAEPIVVDGLGSSALAIGIDLAVAAARLSAVGRMAVGGGDGSKEPRLVERVADSLPAVLSSRTEMTAALTSAQNLIAVGQLAPARQVLASAAEVALDASDLVGFAIAEALELLDLAVRCAHVPSPVARGLLASALIDQSVELDEDVAGVIAALETGDGSDGAGALAAHALAAALRDGRSERAEVLAEIVAAWSGVPPHPVATLVERVQAQSPNLAPLLVPGADIVTKLSRAAQGCLKDAEFSGNTGGREHAVIVVSTSAHDRSDIGGLLEGLDRAASVLVVGLEDEGADSAAVDRRAAAFAEELRLRRPGGLDPEVPVAVARLDASPSAVGDLQESATGVLAVRVARDDIVSLIHDGELGAVDRALVASALHLGVRVTSRSVSLEATGERRVHDLKIDDFVHAARGRAVARLLGRGIARRRDLVGLRALAEQLPAATDATALELAERLDSGEIADGDVDLARQQGAASPTFALLRDRSELGASQRAAVLRWPGLRRRIWRGEPEATAELVELLGAVSSDAAGGLRFAVERAIDDVSDTTILDIARGLSVGVTDRDDFDGVCAAVEDAVAVGIHVDPALLGGPDPVVSLLLGTGQVRDRQGGSEAKPGDRGDLPVDIAVTDGLQVVVGIPRGRVVATLLQDNASQDVQDLLARLRDDEDMASALRRLAVAEARVQAQPDGLWVLDSALAAIDLALALGFSRDAPGDQGVVQLAHLRVGAALERIRELDTRDLMPVLLREPGSEAELARAVQPLRDWIDGLPEADILDGWFAAWAERREVLTAVPYEPDEAGRQELAIALGGVPIRVPVSREVAESGLVGPSANLELSQESGPGGDYTAVLAPRASLPGALHDAIEAWERARPPDASERERLGSERARFVLRALVRGDVESADGRPQLPAVWVNLFDRATGRVLAAAPLTLDDDGWLRASLPSTDVAPGVLVTLARRSDIAPEQVLADALLARPGHRAQVAESLLSLLHSFRSPEIQRALLRGAEVTLESARDERTDVQLADARAARRRLADGADAPARELASYLDTLVVDLLDRCLDERRRAAAEVLRQLSKPEFSRLSDADREARLLALEPRLPLIEQLDSLLP